MESNTAPGAAIPRFIYCPRGSQSSYCKTDYVRGHLLLDRGKETDEVVSQFVKKWKAIQHPELLCPDSSIALEVAKDPIVRQTMYLEIYYLTEAK